MQSVLTCNRKLNQSLTAQIIETSRGEKFKYQEYDITIEMFKQYRSIGTFFHSTVEHGIKVQRTIPHKLFIDQESTVAGFDYERILHRTVTIILIELEYIHIDYSVYVRDQISSIHTTFTSGVRK